MFIKKKPLSGAYVSRIDKHLAEFDRTHAWSERQNAEIKKCRRIFQLRDYPIQSEKKKSVFDFDLIFKSSIKQLK